ncbi:phosphoribosyl-ATP diphosphatase [Myxococcota bacterium]|nr:phosphoribosyl-ATP diphosphatase [Myxococcota bacterium]
MSRSEILEQLFGVIEARKAERPAGSYVVQLLDGGVEAIAAKVIEESREVIEAARHNDSEELAREVADLVFHLWVLLAQREVAPSAVYDVLESRFGVGGLIEKASRGAEK